MHNAYCTLYWIESDHSVYHVCMWPLANTYKYLYIISNEMRLIDTQKMFRCICLQLIFRIHHQKKKCYSLFRSFLCTYKCVSHLLFSCFYLEKFSASSLKYTVIQNIIQNVQVHVEHINLWIK